MHRLVGQDNSKYNGLGYGALSQRTVSYDAPVNKRQFITTGTQSGILDVLDSRHYTTVLEYIPEENLIIAAGPIKPSSESMTLGSVYNMDSSIKAVFHAHSPDIWNNAERLGIPMTNADIEYGTPEMAEDVKRLFRETDVKKLGIFVTGGHQDGVFTFGRTVEEAGFIMLNYLALALKITYAAPQLS
ncbi:MAG: class II aldolase/adducin family protein [Candidatus Aenigmatarchaeota archaeon]